MHFHLLQKENFEQSIGVGDGVGAAVGVGVGTFVGAVVGAVVGLLTVGASVNKAACAFVVGAGDAVGTPSSARAKACSKAPDNRSSNGLSLTKKLVPKNTSFVIVAL